MIVSTSSDAGSSRSSVGSSTLNDAGAWNSNAFGRGWRTGASGAAVSVAAGSAVTAAVAPVGGATGSAGAATIAAGTDRLAPGSGAAGCGAADTSFGTDQLAGDAAGAGAVVNVVVAAGVAATDGVGDAAAAPMEASDPTAAEAAGGTGRRVAGCAAVAPNEPDPSIAVPLDEVAVPAGCAGVGTDGCAASGADVKLTGAGAAGACAAEPGAPVVDGAAAGVAVVSGIDARTNAP